MRSLINGVVGRKLLNVCSKTSESILKNTDLIEHLRHQEFDLALFESVASWCGYVAKALNVPFVTMSTLSTTPDKAWKNRADVSPAYYPAYSSGYDQGMNFTRRFVNTMVYMQVFLSRFAFFWTLESTHSPHSYIPAGLSTPELLGQAEIWFVRTHFALDFARSLPANAIPVGGILTRPAKPLETVSSIFSTLFPWMHISVEGRTPC